MGFNMQIKLHLRRVIPAQKIKTLHKGICEEIILFTLICNEVSKTSIGSELFKPLMNPSCFHEWVVWPFARPHFHIPPEIEILVR
jgi:hypothetical protein